MLPNLRGLRGLVELFELQLRRALLVPLQVFLEPSHATHLIEKWYQTPPESQEVSEPVVVSE